MNFLFFQPNPSKSGPLPQNGDVTPRKPLLQATSSSTSCPQLTLEERQQRFRHHSSSRYDSVDTAVKEENLNDVCPLPPSPATPTKRNSKTYSFKRMMSFRTSRRGTEFGSGGFGQNQNGSSSHLPLQFSFLGQIYRKSSGTSFARRRSSSGPRNVPGTSGAVVGESSGRAKFTIDGSNPSPTEEESEPVS